MLMLRTLSSSGYILSCMGGESSYIEWADGLGWTCGWAGKGLGGVCWSCSRGPAEYWACICGGAGKDGKCCWGNGGCKGAECGGMYGPGRDRDRDRGWTGP